MTAQFPQNSSWGTDDTRVQPAARKKSFPFSLLRKIPPSSSPRTPSVRPDSARSSLGTANSGWSSSSQRYEERFMTPDSARPGLCEG